MCDESSLSSWIGQYGDEWAMLFLGNAEVLKINDRLEMRRKRSFSMYSTEVCRVEEREAFHSGSHWCASMVLANGYDGMKYHYLGREVLSIAETLASITIGLVSLWFKKSISRCVERRCRMPRVGQSESTIFSWCGSVRCHGRSRLHLVWHAVKRKRCILLSSIFSYRGLEWLLSFSNKNNCRRSVSFSFSCSR